MNDSERISRPDTRERFSRFATPEERGRIGGEINPERASVFYAYAQTLDPYGDEPEPPDEYSCIGREFFAADPEVGIAVAFRDLPPATAQALQQKLDAGPKRLRRIVTLHAEK